MVDLWRIKETNLFSGAVSNQLADREEKIQGSSNSQSSETSSISIGHLWIAALNLKCVNPSKFELNFFFSTIQ